MKSRHSKGGGAMRRQARGFSSIVTPESARVLSQAPASALSEAFGVEMDLVRAAAAAKGRGGRPTPRPPRTPLPLRTSRSATSWAARLPSPGRRRATLRRRSASPRRPTRSASFPLTDAGCRRAPPAADADLSATPFLKRKDAGMVVLTFNGARPAVATREQALARGSPEEACPPRCEIEVVGVGMPRGRRYMREDLARRAQALSERLQVLSQAIAQRAGYTDLTPLCEARQDDVRVAGRVCCDAEGALNEKSALLEGDIETAYGRRVRLDVRMADAFSLFPGQVVVCEGLNPRGDRVVARRILQHAPLPLPCSPVHAVQRFHHDPALQGGLPLNIWVAQGPYTASDNLGFQPLEALLQEVAASDTPPDVLLLVRACGPRGPRLPSPPPARRWAPSWTRPTPACRQASWGRCSTTACGSTSLRMTSSNSTVRCPRPRAGGAARNGHPPTPALTHTHTVEKRVSHTLANNVPTRVAIVPSTRDVMARPQYPQPPLDLQFYAGPRVVSLSNPATFRVNEVVVGVNAEDIIRHTMQNEALRCGPRDHSLFPPPPRPRLVPGGRGC